MNHSLLSSTAALGSSRAGRIALWCALAFGGAATASAQRVDISSSVNIDADARFEVREETYSLPEVLLSFPVGEPMPMFPAEMRGVVVAPVNASGPRPVALFIHGQHASCYNPTSGEGEPAYPCADEYTPIPNYLGYLTQQRYLAARGWVTVSINANSVNGSPVYNIESYDVTMRAELVEKHLRQWASWAAGEGDEAPPPILAGLQPDLRQLMVIGHSRGGAAANQVALQSVTDSSLPWRVRAQVLLGPVLSHANPAPLVPAVVLLPGCDGDVVNLVGQGYIDRARDLIADPALRSGIFIDGANHNFFNTEWDPQTATLPSTARDDVATFFEDRPSQGACRAGAPERLSGDAQRELSSFYIAAAGKAFVQGDPGVVPLFDGSPVCAGPTCRANVRTHALGGRRQPLLIPQHELAVQTSNEQLTVEPCLTARKVSEEGACITGDMAEFKKVTRTPHFTTVLDRDPSLAQPQAEPSQTALRMQWGAGLGAARIETSQRSLSADGTHVVLRVIVPPDAVDTRFSVALVDSADRVLPLGAATLSGVPANAGPGTGVYWAQEVRFAIDRSTASAAGLNVDAIQAIELMPQSANGSLWLLDVWSYASGVATGGGGAARFEVSTAPVTPDASSQLRVPATVIGELREPAEIYYFADETGTEETVTVPAGARTFFVTVPVRSSGDGPSVQYIGVRGMVPTKRLDVVTISQPSE